MRQIKFRAYDKKKGKWLLGYEVTSLGGFSLYGEIILFGEWASVLDTYLFDKKGHNIEDLVVTQFTGLLDTNGKEIYEGDILENPFVGDSWEVVFVDGCFSASLIGQDLTECLQFITGSDYPCEKKWKIIGNIFENPELLNSK